MRVTQKLVIASIVVVLLALSSLQVQAQTDIDDICAQSRGTWLANCPGYNFAFLRTSGTDWNPIDSQFVPLPNGSTYSTGTPICAISTYMTNDDNDMGWRCTWKQSTEYGQDGYRFTLELMYAKGLSQTVNATAVVLDINLLTSFNWWYFNAQEDMTASSPDHYLSPQQYPIISLNTFDTKEDDDLIFWTNVVFPGYGEPEVTVTNGHNTPYSYVDGIYYIVDPSSQIFFCQYAITVYDGDGYTWDSRLASPYRGETSQCENFNYSQQLPLIIVSLVDYPPSDRDFEVSIDNYHIEQQGQSVWAEMYVYGGGGNSDSYANFIVTILGLR